MAINITHSVTNTSLNATSSQFNCGKEGVAKTTRRTRQLPSLLPITLHDHMEAFSPEEIL
ncbi:hypothetical protein BBBOND_0400950 [Babesia bigemina]|uniref:Uncharacterized protein n=1 Tax=Babesia bigemina TaxID=5866 RepID=A0A061DAM6_BABBI|nr:hypothetical protein BBBOND_0400950 [Babesia bigemina]CDR97603.1 hypothetical protein BBBOND_0400950 [Babesia bigemina]|eukprot:XP_012769789.1 hypothetical protein BBBOND_0400950 [Babesia bigemina]